MSKVDWPGLQAALPSGKGAIRWSLGVEVSEAEARSIELPSEVEFAILRPPEGSSALSLTDCQSWRVPLAILSHLTALESPEKAFEALAQGKGPRIALELAVTASQVSPPLGEVRNWVRGGGWVVLSSRPERPEDLRRLDLAVGVAARAWVPRTAVYNAVPAA